MNWHSVERDPTQSTAPTPLPPKPTPGHDNTLRNAAFEDALLLSIARIAEQCARRRVSRDLARDIAQDITLDALVKIRSGRMQVIEGSLRALVARMVRDRLADHFRGAARAADFAVELHGGLAADTRPWMEPDRAIEEQELDEFVERTLAGLPATCRRTFVMVRQDDVPYNDVARALGVSRNAVCNHVVYAQRRFRLGLGKLGVQTPPPYAGPARRDRSPSRAEGQNRNLSNGDAL